MIKLGHYYKNKNTYVFITAQSSGVFIGCTQDDKFISIKKTETKWEEITKEEYYNHKKEKKS